MQVHSHAGVNHLHCFAQEAAEAVVNPKKSKATKGSGTRAKKSPTKKAASSASSSLQTEEKGNVPTYEELMAALEVASVFKVPALKGNTNNTRSVDRGARHESRMVQTLRSSISEL